MENQKQKQKKYKNSLPKRLSNIFFVLFFCIFSAFTLIAYSSTNYFLLKKEKQSVFQAVNIVRVQDKGEGISKEDIEHIFERFYRTDKSRNRTSTQAGLGIGLSILKQIVDGYHLQMKVESELNEGSVFILHIPLAQSKES